MKSAPERESELSLAVVITAAGVSSRMGTGEKKEYFPIDERTVLRHCIDAFQATAGVAAIVVTHPQDLREETERAIGTTAGTIMLEPGGRTRQQSVLNGLRRLAEVSPRIVLIHDGSRPWVDSATIERVIYGADRDGACIPVVPPTDAVKLLTADGSVKQHFARGSTCCAQTPQGFAYAAILRAHERAAEESHLYVDDAELYDAHVGPVSTVPGDPRNRKITYRHDLPDDTARSRP